MNRHRRLNHQTLRESPTVKDKWGGGREDPEEQRQRMREENTRKKYNTLQVMINNVSVKQEQDAIRKDYFVRAL